VCVCVCVYLCTHTPISSAYACVCVCMSEFRIHTHTLTLTHTHTHIVWVILQYTHSYHCQSEQLRTYPIMPGSNHILPLIKRQGKSYKVIPFLYSLGGEKTLSKHAESVTQAIHTLVCACACMHCHTHNIAETFSE
jgi:hypothetical protein